jgi:hypothetical protein
VHAGIAVALMIGWGILAAWWAHAQRDALRHEQQEEMRRHAGSAPRPRDMRLSPLQINYLNVVEKYTPKDR